MSYLIINEDLKTFGHNYWTRAFGHGHYLNTKINPIGYGVATGINAYNSQRAQGAMLQNMVGLGSNPVSKASALKTGLIGGAINIGIGLLNNKLGFTDEIDNKYFDSMYRIPDKIKNKLREWCKKIPEAIPVTVKQMETKKGMQMNSKDALARRHTRLATRGFGKGMFTTATSYKKIPTGKDGCYVVYFTFDGDSIEDAKVLCLKKGSNPDDDKNFFVKKIPQWNSSVSDECKIN